MQYMSPLPDKKSQKPTYGVDEHGICMAHVKGICNNHKLLLVYQNWFTNVGDVATDFYGGFSRLSNIILDLNYSPIRSIFKL